MRLIVVRHGTATPKASWTGRDDDRPLVARGQRQAIALASALAGYRPARILSSPSLRCFDTVKPLADNRKMTVEPVGSLARHAGDAALDLIHDLIGSKHPSSVIVLCTHREVIADVLPHLARTSHLRLEHRLPGAKGACWELTYRNKKLIGVHYSPAPT